MGLINVNKADFVKSAASPSQFIPAGLPRVAFAGRSNVGKSSVINRLLNRKNFARVGSAPGKTIHVNYFLIDGKLYLMDLPGYGYAQVSQAERKRWAKLMEDLFAQGDTIDLGVLVVDVRHAPTQDDCTMAQWFRSAGRPMVVVANKLDKLKKSQIPACLEQVRETLGLEEGELIPFSAQTGQGREELLQRIEAIL